MGIWSITIAILLVMCGVLAAAECLVKKRPEAGRIIEKLHPYQGIIGIITCLWGAWSFIWVLVTLKDMGGAPGGVWVWWVTYLVTAITAIALGFMLGFRLFSKKCLTDSEEAREKGEKLLAKLDAYKIPLGKLGILLGIWCILAIIIWIPLSPLFVGVVKSIILLIVGALAAAALIAQKQPEAGKALEKLMPYQGIIGTLAALSGIMCVIYALRIVGNISDLAELATNNEMFAAKTSSAGGFWVWWITFLILNLYTIVLGFLLGFPLIKKYVLPACGCGSCCDDTCNEATPECASESEPAPDPESGGEKIEAVVAKLSALQIKLGLIGIALAIWGFIAALIWAPSSDEIHAAAFIKALKDAFSG
jgi:hypothetical protein